jgi:hypothetical protein
MNMVTDKRIKFWRVPDLRNLELLSARQEHSFPRRMHDRFEISVIESGAERLWYRGNTYTASVDTPEVILPSPGGARRWVIVHEQSENKVAAHAVGDPTIKH